MIKIYGRKNLEKFTGMLWDNIRNCIAYRGFPEADGTDIFGGRTVTYWIEDEVKEWLDKNPKEVRRKRHVLSWYSKYETKDIKNEDDKRIGINNSEEGRKEVTS